MVNNKNYDDFICIYILKMKDLKMLMKIIFIFEISLNFEENLIIRYVIMYYVFIILLVKLFFKLVFFDDN